MSVTSQNDRDLFIFFALAVSFSLGNHKSIATAPNQCNRPWRKQIWVVKYSNSWWWCNNCNGDKYPTAFLACPCPNKTEPVIVETKIDITSNANDDSNKNRRVNFAFRKNFVSVFFGADSSRVSLNVTKTAPATNAAGAPIFAVHSLERERKQCEFE